MNLLDLIFPRRCVSCGGIGTYICEGCEKKIVYLENPICPVCQRQAVGGVTHPGCKTRYSLNGLVVAFRYVGPIKLAIKMIKYKWVWDIADNLVDKYSGELWKFNMPDNFVLVPVPLHVRRRRWRGFNQAELICKVLAKRFAVEWDDLLVRILETKTQVGLSRDERRTNIRGAFGTAEKISRDKTYILVDDVFTTGATMNEACRILKKAGAGNVWGMTIALG